MSAKFVVAGAVALALSAVSPASAHDRAAQPLLSHEGLDDIENNIGLLGLIGLLGFLGLRGRDSRR